MIESIITDYLEHNRRLVVPELGAFLKKEGGEVVFVPFLNKDDGILTGLVRHTYGTSSAEAEGIIVQYVETVREGIESNGVYLVAPFGSLKRDANGILFLDTADLTANPVRQKKVVVTERVLDEVPVLEEVVVVPEPEPKVRQPVVVAETPKMLNDLIREKQGKKADEPETVHARIKEGMAPEVKSIVPNPAKERKSVKPLPQKPKPAPAQKQKRADMVLILAIAVAAIAVIAMIYAFWVVDLPVLNLE